MIDSGLLVEARRILDRARMIAEAPAARPSEIGHGHAQSAMPAGVSFTRAGGIAPAGASTLQQLGEQINQAIATGSDHELERANKWCATELESLQHAPARPAETQLEFRDRVCRCYEGQLAGVVARLEMTTVTTVRKLRVQAGRDARYGRKP